MKSAELTSSIESALQYQRKIPILYDSEPTRKTAIGHSRMSKKDKLLLNHVNSDCTQLKEDLDKSNTDSIEAYGKLDSNTTEISKKQKGTQTNLLEIIGMINKLKVKLNQQKNLDADFRNLSLVTKVWDQESNKIKRIEMKTIQINKKKSKIKEIKNQKLDQETNKHNFEINRFPRPLIGNQSLGLGN